MHYALCTLTMNETILRTIHAQILERIAEITASPKPTYSVDGQEIKWTEYLKSLRETAAWIEKQLNSQEPFEIISNCQ